MAETKKKSEIAEVTEKILKTFGKGSVFTFNSKVELTPSMSTGSITLNHAIGIGGYPKGRISEIFGAESSGKTSLALTAVAQVQKHGGKAAYIDTEYALDPSYMKILGVNIKDLLISQPDNAEEALQLYDFYIANDLVDIIVLDSVAALVPKIELDGEVGDSHVALVARLMSQMMRKITGNVSKTECIALFINQTRTKIGGQSFGDNQDTTGGKALKFYAAIRLKVARIGYEKDGENTIGSKLKIQVVKNKVAPPYKVANPILFYDRGFDEVYECLDLWVKAKTVEQSGTFYSYKNERIGQGKKGVSEFLRQNPKILQEIRKEAGDLSLLLELKPQVEKEETADISTEFTKE